MIFERMKNILIKNYGFFLLWILSSFYNTYGRDEMSCSYDDIGISVIVKIKERNLQVFVRIICTEKDHYLIKK